MFFMNKRKLLIIVCMILSFSFTGIIANAASGLSEIYWMTSTSSGGSGVGPGGSASIQTSLSGMGYNASRYQDTHAYYVRRTMNNDIVFAIVSHGAPGRVVGDQHTTMSANAVASDNANYSLAAYFGSDDFNSMKFAYYGACQTARTDATYGNLLSYTTSTLGAASALGFYNSVYDSQATYFEQQLFINLRNGSTVSSSANAAKSATYSKYGSYGEVDTYRIYGNSSTKIN
jgi:hypothetical protein